MKSRRYLDSNSSSSGSDNDTILSSAAHLDNTSTSSSSYPFGNKYSHGGSRTPDELYDSLPSEGTPLQYKDHPHVPKVGQIYVLQRDGHQQAEFDVKPYLDTACTEPQEQGSSLDQPRIQKHISEDLYDAFLKQYAVHNAECFYCYVCHVSVLDILTSQCTNSLLSSYRF